MCLNGNKQWAGNAQSAFPAFFFCSMIICMKFIYKDTCGVAESEILKNSEKLSLYTESLKKIIAEGKYLEPESSIVLPTDSEIMDAVSEIKNKLYSPKLKYIFLVGIGGQNLGVKAIYEAVYNEPYGLGSSVPKIIFVDTVNPNFLSKLQNFITNEVSDPEELAIIISSKSGSTLEISVNAELLSGFVEGAFPKTLASRTAVITNKNSPLWSLAKEKKYSILEMPEIVGGRYSVMSAVGLFPLAVVGIDVALLLSGAKDMREKCLGVDLLNNPAMASASILFDQIQSGKNIADMFIFNGELESLGKWCRQLLAESIGKEKNKKGEVVNTGIVPTVSIGSTDLHSMAQLYFGGPRNRFTYFIFAKNSFNKQVLVKDGIASVLSGNVSGKTPEVIIESICEAVKKTYASEKMPFAEIIFDEIYTRELGEFMQFKMIETMYLGELLDVNAFDQPSVEAYKKETRILLSK